MLCHGLSLKRLWSDFYYVKAVTTANVDLLANLSLTKNNPGHHLNPLDPTINTFLFSIFQEPIYFYGLNLFLFYGNVLLLYLIVHFLTQSKGTALTAAALFTVHPFNAEVLCHATFSTVLLTAGFLQLSFIYFLKNFLAQKISKGWLWLSLISYVFALLYLETSLLFPAYLTALCLFYRNSLEKNSSTLPGHIGYWRFYISVFGLTMST